MSDDETPPLEETPNDAAAPEPAKPVYDQAFFLDLARPRGLSKEALAEACERWNAWRRDPANDKVLVTFKGVDFRTAENRGISFEKFEFGGHARFDGATFDLWMRFDGATFGRLASFAGAIFSDWASFTGATFGLWVRFDGATFGDEARFDGATFGKGASFAGTAFGDGARFDGATFGDGASFAGTAFGDGARFDGTTFGDGARFDDATFCDGASFVGVAGERDVEAWQKGWAEDIKASRKGWAEIEEALRVGREMDYRACREANDFGPAKFSNLSFARVHFRGSISFARRSFERSANFTDVRFDQPPDFDDATNLHRIDFTGAFPWTVMSRWLPRGWTTDSTVLVRWRAFRSLIEGTKNHDFERDLYIEERRVERGIYAARKLKEGYGALAAHLLWIGVMALYWALSDYGRSWLRPAVWLGVVVLLFHGVGPVDGLAARALAGKRAAIVAAAEQGQPGHGAEVGARWDEAVGLYAVANSIPFVGPLTIDGEVKKFLFCGEPARPADLGKPPPAPCVPIPPASLQVATISQNLLSIILVFFIGLALRNYFRVK